MTSITVYEEKELLLRVSEEALLKKKLRECLKARQKKNSKMQLQPSDVFYIRGLIEKFEADVERNFVHLEERKGTFIVRISISNLQACFYLRALLSFAEINNTEADAILMRHQRRLSSIEASETFWSNFVNCLDFDDDNKVKDWHRNVNLARVENYLSPFELACHIRNEELVAMFIYYDAEANSASQKQYTYGVHKESVPIFYAAEMGHKNIVEMLIHFINDQRNDFDVDTLVPVMLTDSLRIFFELALLATKCCSSTATLFWDPECHLAIWEMLFDMDSSCLHTILQFYSESEEACGFLMDCFENEHWESYWLDGDLENMASRTTFFDNLAILASTTLCDVKAAHKNEPKRTFLHAMMDKIHDEWPLRVVMLVCLSRKVVPINEIESLILLLLSNNAPMDKGTFQMIYELSCQVDTKLFEICKVQEVDCSQKQVVSWNIFGAPTFPVSSFYCDFPHCKTIMDVFGDPANQIHENDIAYFTSLSSHLAVKQKAYSMEEPELTAKADRLPKCPTLLEFARDAARKHVVKQYDVKTNWQFYEAVKSLEIPRHLKNFIAYDKNVPLYR